MEFNAEIKPAAAAPPHSPHRPEELHHLDKKTWFSLLRNVKHIFLCFYVIFMGQLQPKLAYFSWAGEKK